MSAAARCQTCVCCGRPINEGDAASIEVILEMDAPPHYVAVLWGHSTFPSNKEGR